MTFGLAGATSLKKQLIAGLETKDFYIATWGIRPAPTTLSSDDHIPSVLSNLKEQKLIPSLSWGYTAGAYYQSMMNAHGVGSLTFGGYDAARFVPNNITFDFSSNQARDLSVGLQSIRLLTPNQSSIELLPSPIETLIDATVPQIWLPVAACQLFEKAFHLVYNDTIGLYFFSSTNPPMQNSTLSFQIAPTTANASAVNITIPFAALNLHLTSDYPGNNPKNTQYFPLHRAANGSQYTLGRSFLQQAYVIANYERRTFSVSQAVFPNSTNSDIHAILSPEHAQFLPPEHTWSRIPMYVGAVLGPLCFLAILTVSLGMLHRRGKFPIFWFFEFFPCFRAPQADAVEDITGKDADVFSIQDSPFNANTRYYAK